MFKRITAVTFAAIAFVGWFDGPAHSEPLEEAALMVLAAQACGRDVPDAVFLPKVQFVAIQTGTNMAIALNIVASQAEIMAAKLINAGKADEFCTAISNISFE